MKRFYDAIVLFAIVFEPLTRPNHGITSVSQLCRKKRIDEDLVRRYAAKLEKKYSAPLFEVRNHRLELTALGQRVLLEVALKDLALVESGEEAIETLTVECAPYLAEALFPKILPAFMQDFGGPIALRIFNLEAAAVQQNIATHKTDFGIAILEDGAGSGVEALDANIAALLAIPSGHRLQDHVGPVAASDLQLDDRVFIPGEALTLPDLGEWLKSVKSANRVECDSLNLFRRCVGAGLGLGVILGFGGECQSDGVTIRPISGVKEQRLCFHVPRRSADLSEPARALMDEIRKHLESLKANSRGSMEPAAVSTPLAVSNGDSSELPTTPSEGTRS